MRWIEPNPTSEVPAAARIALLRQALATHPADPDLHTRLGNACRETGLLREACESYETAARADVTAFRAWAELAACYCRLGRADAALDACRRADAKGPNARVAYWRGCALEALGRPGEARAAFTAALRLAPHQFSALRRLLSPLAKDPDGAPLLDFCDALPTPYKQTALVLANRAIALSRLGRTDDALRMVDLDRHVAQVPFVPPAADGDVARFNRRLADEILADPVPVSPERDDTQANYLARHQRSDAFVALRAFMKEAIAAYLGEADDRGLSAFMPPPPQAALLGGTGVVLRGNGANGQHVHGDAYISAVYYVSVPRSITEAADRRGALALGCCDRHTGGYVPCWGVRHIKPTAGCLVIFPSHIFHDVVPPLSDEPRISVAADMKPRA